MYFGNYFKSWYFHVVLDAVQVNTSLPLSKPHLNTALKLFDFFFLNPFNTSALPNSRSAIQCSLLQPTLPWGLCLHPHPAAQVVTFLSAPYHCHAPLLETGARRLKTHSFSWDFHLFAPSSLPLLCVNISWAEAGGKALVFTLLAVYSLKQELHSEAAEGRRMFKIEVFLTFCWTYFFETKISFEMSASTDS